jgi:hypothetical protein
MRSLAARARRLSLAALLISVPFALPAQESAPAMLSGVVRDTLGKPLADVEVVVVGVGLSARTSRDGVYAVLGIPPGIRRVVIRRVGFEQIVHDLEIAPGADARMDVDLFPTAHRLAEVVVEERKPIVGPIAGFEHRRRNYNGTFIDEAAIARRKPIRTTDLVRGVAGVKVRNAPRGPGFLIWMGVGGAECKPTLFLDGLPVTESTLDNLPAMDIVGVEVYRKAYDAPPPFLSTSGCGVVAFWSRTGPPRDEGGGE